jgi:hypothetical protein
MSVSSKLKGPQDYRPPVRHHPVPGSLTPTLHVTLMLETAVRRLLQCRCLTITVLVVGIGDMIAGSPARAQTSHGPPLNVHSLPVSRETETNPKAKTNCTQDRCRRLTQELDHALSARLELLYPNTCEGSDGQTFAIREEESRFQGNVATVSYVLVLFETCEEGSPYEASSHEEKWAYKAQGWQFVEDVSSILKVR